MRKNMQLNWVNILQNFMLIIFWRHCSGFYVLRTRNCLTKVFISQYEENYTNYQYTVITQIYVSKQSARR